MLRRFSSCLFVYLVGLGLGCTAECYAQTQTPAVVFVADGAGGFMTTSRGMENAARESRPDLEVRSFHWSHGFGRMASDQCDHAHLRRSGCSLAKEVAAYQAQHPGARVYLLGHSAGTAVVMMAAEQLPPDSIERIVLLAPSLSENYDVRPALRCSRLGMDAYCSHKDWLFLGLAVKVFGYADSRRGPAAGRNGFRTRADCPEDAALLTKLRHHPWEPSMKAAGHTGGHIGVHHPTFLKQYILPLLP